MTKIGEEVDKKLDRWIRSQAFIDRDLGKLLKVTIRHSAPGKKGKVIHTIKIDSEFDDDSVEEIVIELINQMQEHADGLGGMQRYITNAHFDDGEAEFTCRVWGHDSEFDMNDCEAPNSAGLVAMSQRHLEQVMRISNATLGTTLTFMQRTIARQNDQIEKMFEQRYSDFELMESLRSKQHERDMNMLEHESSEERKNALFEKAMLLAPVLLNRIAGKKVLPTETSSEQNMLKSFVETLDTSQFEKIMSTLKLEQQVALLELLNTFKSAEEEKKEGNKDAVSH